MHTSSNRIVANYYPSTHPGVMTCAFSALFLFLVAFSHMYTEGKLELWQKGFVCVAVLCVVVYYAVKWTKTIIFTSEGILFQRFGKEYRFLPWKEVVQVGIALEYQAARPTLVITPCGCPVHDVTNKFTTSYVERNRRKLIRLDATKSNVAAVKHFYGQLDYESK